VVEEDNHVSSVRALDFIRIDFGEMMAVAMLLESCRNDFRPSGLQWVVRASGDLQGRGPGVSLWTPLFADELEWKPTLENDHEYRCLVSCNFCELLLFSLTLMNGWSPWWGCILLQGM
jgi:hypothetical protein